MAELRANGVGVPIHFSVGDDGLATIIALRFSIRFGFRDTFVWIECEVYDPLTFALSHIMPEVSKLSNDGTTI